MAGESSASGESSPPPATSRRALRDLAAVILGLGIGISLALVAFGRPAGEAPNIRLPAVAPRPTAVPPAPAPARLTPGPEPTAEAAVTAFLEAERAGDLAASFALLSSADQASFRSPAGWVAAHADLLPPIVSYRIEQTRSAGEQTLVQASLELQPSLDLVVGLVPARADATWVTMDEGDGWRILLEESSLVPIYPSEEGIPEAVRAWVEARRACLETEQSVTLLGRPSLAEQLCGAPGPLRIGEPGHLLDAVDAAPFLAAFGPEFDRWARVMPLAGPVAMRVVVAPLSDDWAVIGVLPGTGP